jgi:hypothetical protein
MTHHATDTQRGLRVTSKQVDDILQCLAAKPESAKTTIINDMAIEAICRDLLDARGRLAAAERVVRMAQEAIVHGDVYRRALASELRRLAPDEPLHIHPDLSLKAGAAMGRFRAAYDASSPASEEDDCE